MKLETLLLAGLFMTPGLATAQTQNEEVRQKNSRLQVGGYGEVAYTREFFSDNVYRYSQAGKYKNDPSHGRFDIPHAVVYLSYDFGKGWSMSSEIEFEHGGGGVTWEKEYEEAGEWEQEVEKGGEVELEQFWIQKSIFPQLNIKAGHIVVPVGYTNAHHEPLNFFTVYRPEGEATIFPCTWHETGISIWGRHKAWRYEAQFLAGLDAMNFRRDTWIQKGANSLFEFKPANKYGVAVRVDNYSLPGLRVGVSGYYGHSIDNTYTRESNSNAKPRRYKGAVSIAAVDFSYEGHGFTVRGNYDYGHLSDADQLFNMGDRVTQTSPYTNDHVASDVMAGGIEAGYDVFYPSDKMRQRGQRLIAFGRYEYYDSYYKGSQKGKFNYTQKHRLALGLNYFPIPQVVVKAEWSKRFLRSAYNDEPSVSVGVAYQGFFTK